MIENVSNTKNGDFTLLLLVFTRGVSFGKINQAVTNILKITSFHGLVVFLLLNDCMTIVHGFKISPKNMLKSNLISPSFGLKIKHHSNHHLNPMTDPWYIYLHLVDFL